MTTTIYVHIGSSKTGSSAIQGILQQNFRLLQQHGYIYPNLGKRLDAHPYINHASFFKQPAPQIVKELARCIHFCRQKKIHSIVLSRETIGVSNWKPLILIQKRFPKIRFKIICYLRRQDKWLESSWKQWGIKTEYEKIEDFVKHHELGIKNCNWYQYYKEWRDSFPQAELCFVPYERKQFYKEDLIVDFFKHIEFTATDRINRNTGDSYQANNKGFAREIIEFIHINKSLFSHIHDNRLFHFINDTLGEDAQKKPFETYHFLPPQKKIEILQNFEKSNLNLAAALSRKKGENFFKEPWPNEEDPWQPYSGLTWQDSIRIVSKLLFRTYLTNKIATQKMTNLHSTVARLTQQNSKYKDDINKLKRRLHRVENIIK